MGMRVFVADRRLDAGDARPPEEVVAYLDRRRLVAQPHARSAHHPHAGSELGRERREQCLGAEQGTGEAVADAHGESRDVLAVLLYDVEMRVEGCRLEHFGKGQAHFLGERGQVRRGDLAVGVLDPVQVFDQQVAVARRLAKQCPNRIRGARLDLAPLGHRPHTCTTPARMLEFSYLANVAGAVVISHCCIVKERRREGTAPGGCGGLEAIA
jgi:hypothetical protein